MKTREFQLDPRAQRILRRRRIWRAAKWAVVALIVAAVIASLSGFGAGAASDHARFHQRRVRVVEIDQGDSLIIDLDGRPTTVRLIGIDANGSLAARDLLRRLCGDHATLYLQDMPTRDRAGRLLAYAYDDSGTLLNDAAIRAGLAYADRRWDYAYKTPFVQAETAAAGKRIGLWADDAHEATMPDWRKRWLAEYRKKPWDRAEWVRANEP